MQDIDGRLELGTLWMRKIEAEFVFFDKVGPIQQPARAGRFECLGGSNPTFGSRGCSRRGWEIIPYSTYLENLLYFIYKLLFVRIVFFLVQGVKFSMQ